MYINSPAQGSQPPKPPASTQHSIPFSNKLHKSSRRHWDDPCLYSNYPPGLRSWDNATSHQIPLLIRPQLNVMSSSHPTLEDQFYQNASISLMTSQLLSWNSSKPLHLQLGQRLSWSYPLPDASQDHGLSWSPYWDKLNTFPPFICHVWLCTCLWKVQNIKGIVSFCNPTLWFLQPMHASFTPKSTSLPTTQPLLTRISHITSMRSAQNKYINKRRNK